MSLPGVGLVPEERTSRPLRLTLVTNFVLAGGSIITGVTVARLLSPAARGELAAIQLWPTVLASLAALGMPEAVVYFTARDKGSAGRYVATAMGIASIGSFVLVTLGWFLLPVILQHQSHEVIRAAQICLLLVPVYSVVFLPSHALRGTGDFLLWNLLRVAPVTVWFVVLVAATMSGERDPSWLGYTQVLGVGGVSMIGLLFVRPKIRGPYVLDFGRARRLAAFGLPAVGTTVPQMANLRLDQMIMASVVPPRDLGLYVVAVAWSAGVTPALHAIGSTLFPRVAREPVAGDQRRVVGQIGWASILVTLAITALVGAATPFGISLLFSEEFAGATASAAILVVASGIAGFNFILSEGSRGLNKPVIALRGELCGLVMTGMSLAVLLPALGILGAAISSVVGYATVTVLLVTSLRRDGVTFFRPSDTLQLIADARVALGRGRRFPR